MMTEAELAPQTLDTATALPAHCYVDPAAVELDRIAVFARSWQLVARADALSGGGDHVVCEIAGVPLLLVRGTDGTLRALHNVCRHRAGPLALCDGRGARRFACRYHGWTYALDGRLLSAPEMTDTEDFDVAKVRLPEAQVGEWQGLVFAALGNVPPLVEVLDGIAERCAAHPLGDHVFANRISYDVACNWKAYVDNFLEGYHLPHVHPELNRLLDYRSYVTETRRWHSLQYSPIEDRATTGIYAGGEALYWYVWPNTMLNVLPGRLQTNRVLPIGAERCRVEFDYYYAADDPTRDALRDADQAFSDAVQHEDIAICEQVQRGLASGSYVAGRLNPRRESGVHHFHELLRAAYRAQRTAAAETGVT
jgi:choline monooxygenase